MDDDKATPERWWLRSWNAAAMADFMASPSVRAAEGEVRRRIAVAALAEAAGIKSVCRDARLRAAERIRLGVPGVDATASGGLVVEHAGGDTFVRDILGVLIDGEPPPEHHMRSYSTWYDGRSPLYVAVGYVAHLLRTATRRLHASGDVADDADDIRETPDFTERLRLTFGNPFRPVVLDPAHLTPDVLGVHAACLDRGATRVYACVLADAFEDAGCTDERVLMPLRGKKTLPLPECRCGLPTDQRLWVGGVPQMVGPADCPCAGRTDWVEYRVALPAASHHVLWEIARTAEGIRRA